ncbi:hypothetical protein ACQF36_29330 [Streptomyces sp. Marseille-Q5077]|uniref:hypothetical protein n=1 Tax=Streptomyces sp. Marseille-Q5077 TaxID=3418995 RepID=UPI003CFD08B2
MVGGPVGARGFSQGQQHSGYPGRPSRLFSTQNVTPLVYKSAVDDTAKAALNGVSAKLTTQVLLDMMK